MLNGLVRLMLAKMNVTTVTQWFGATKSDRGMNLLQQFVFLDEQVLIVG